MIGGKYYIRNKGRRLMGCAWVYLSAKSLKFGGKDRGGIPTREECKSGRD